MLDTKMSTVVLRNNAITRTLIVAHCNNERVIALLQSIVDVFRIVRYGKKLISFCRGKNENLLTWWK